MNIVQVLFVLFFVLSVGASADKLCIKKRVQVINGKVKTAKLIKVENECPRRFIEVLDTEVFKGDDGLDGENGSSVFDETLPSGKLVKGNYSIVFVATAFDQYGKSIISFPVPAPSTPNFRFVREGSPDPNGNCTGTVLNPDASPGYLCIYESTGKVVNSQASALIDSSGNGPEKIDIFGTTIVYRSSGAGEVIAAGSWAYRSP